jgi:PAS domain S-box-containing protein
MMQMKNKKLSTDKARSANDINLSVSEKNNVDVVKILDFLNYPLYVVDLDYKITYANRAAKKRGVKAGCFCYQATHKRNAPCEDVDICPLAEVKKTKETVVTDHIHYDQDGNTIYVEVHGDPILDDQGGVIQMIEYAIDITAHKRVEVEIARLANLNQDIIEHSPLGIFVFNSSGIVEYVNNSMAEISGTTKEKLMSQNLLDHAGYRSIGLDRSIAELVKNKKEFKTDIIRYRSLMGGKETYRIFHGYPLLDESGNIYKAFLTIEDVTTLKKTNEDLQRLNRLMIDRELKMVELKRQLDVAKQKPKAEKPI